MASRWIRGTAAGETIDSTFLSADEGERYQVLLGRGAPRDRQEPVARLAAVLEALGPEPGAACFGRQVHGARIVHVVDPEGGSIGADADRAAYEPGSVCRVGACDALMTTAHSVGLVVWTADCAPVLLAGGGVIAAVHSGWRGAAQGIVAHAVNAMTRLHGVPPREIRAVIGPAIGPCHYPVGDEVVEALAGRSVPEAAWLVRGAQARVDIRGLLRFELEAAGLRADRVEILGGCTACDPTLASYRRDKESAGRLWSMVTRCSEDRQDGGRR